MTQNVYSDSLSDQRRESNDTPASNEIRADIDQTRASVGDKIDQLQARLDPNRLKAQAQETVQEMLSDTANSMTDYVRTHKDEMVSSIADAARRNPLPTALMGLGLGWLILESMAGNKRHDDERWDERRDYERRAFRAQQRSRFEGSTGRSYVSQGRGQFMEEDYSPEYYDTTDYGRSSYPAASEMRSQGETEYQGDYQNRQEYGNGHHRGSNPIAKATDAVKNTMGDMGQEIKERVDDVKDRVSDTVSNTVEEVKDRVSNKIDDVRHQADHISQQGQRSLQRTGYRMEEWQQQARYQGQRRGQQMMRNLEDNPLTYGAIALAAGAALALLLPQTHTENRAFGEMRDQVMEKGQEVMESAKERAQEVASEIAPELEQKARQIASDVKETGKEALKDAAEEMRPVVDKAMSRGKEEARSVAKEAGVDPNMLSGNKPSSGSSSAGSSSTGSSTAGIATGTSTMSTSSSSMGQGKTPVINRDTLRGQWKQIKGEVKSQWGKLTDDDLTRAEGDYEKLLGVIQTRYGYNRQRAEQEINNFFNSHKA